MSSFVKPEFYKLVKPFIEKFFGGFEVQASVQKLPKIGKYAGKKTYLPLRRNITTMDLVEHFYASPKMDKNSVQGSLAVIPPIVGGYLRFVCIDIDDAALKDKVYAKLLPFFTEKNLPYIIELGGDNLDRCHIWILTKLQPGIAKIFFKNLLEAAGFTLQELDEVFGINKPNNLIRLPGGAHIWRGNKRFPLEVGYDHIIDPIGIMNIFLNSQILDLPYIYQMELDEYTIPKILPKRITEGGTTNKKYTYQSRNLPVPEGTPSKVVPIFRECQALNKILVDTKNETKKNDLGELFHWGVLQLQRLGKINDCKSDKEEGKEWFEDITDNVSHAKTHNWNSNQDQIALNPGRFIPNCQKLEDKCNTCEGCPFKGVISSPSTFLNSNPISPTLIEPIGLLTPAEIAENTFKDFRDNILHLLESNKSDNLLLASPQGVGKSSLVSRIAAELGNQGKKVLLAVNTAKVAIEHKERIEAAGGTAFLLMSHKSIFQYLSPFPCPKNKEIQELSDLGVSSSIYKSDFCKGCPLYDKCYYPTQYTEVMEDKHNVVIIQHAHLQCQEVVWELIKKNFDILFIDESFIKSCFTFIKPNQLEIDILTSTKNELFKWPAMLGRWLAGIDEAGSHLGPKESQLKTIKKEFDDAKLPWTVPDYIRYYNQHRTCHPISGIEIIYELPWIPVVTLTDATPPKELIKALTGIENIKSFGSKEVLDVKRIHKDNEIIQLLDTSSSVTFLEKDKNMENLLFKIGELCQEVYTDKKVLLTIYKKHYEIIWRFFETHFEEFPNILDRFRDDWNQSPCENPIYVDWMDKGTNEFADYDVQFLMAGIYFRPDQYEMETYKINAVRNHFNKVKGRDPINLIYPPEEINNKYMDLERLRIRRIEIIDGISGLYEYPMFHTYAPVDKWYNILYELNMATTQQAIRLRFTENKPRTVYILNNYKLPSIVVTKSLTFANFIIPLEKDNEKLS